MAYNVSAVHDAAEAERQLGEAVSAALHCQQHFTARGGKAATAAAA
jgi:hypothetical protein